MVDMSTRPSHPEEACHNGVTGQVTRDVVAAEVGTSAVDQPGTVAIVHDYLTQRGGAERVVLAMHRAFPACAHLHVVVRA